MSPSKSIKQAFTHLQQTLNRLLPTTKPQPASKEIFTFLGFVGLATLIWLAHAWYTLEPQDGSVPAEQTHKEAEEILIDKSFTVPITLKNVPRGQHMVIFPQEATVVVSVSSKHYNDVHEEDIQAFVNYPSQKTDKLEVQVRHQSKHIITWRVTPTRVDYLIEQK